jgi:hypothetical protein
MKFANASKLDKKSGVRLGEHGHPSRTIDRGWEMKSARAAKLVWTRLISLTSFTSVSRGACTHASATCRSQRERGSADGTKLTRHLL